MIVYILIKITHKDTRCGLFKIWMKLVYNNPEEFYACSRRRIIRQSEPGLGRLRETPLGLCLRVIVNVEFHPNLEKSTSSVLSVILINLWFHIHFVNLLRIIFARRGREEEENVGCDVLDIELLPLQRVEHQSEGLPSLLRLEQTTILKTRKSFLNF